MGMKQKVILLGLCIALVLSLGLTCNANAQDTATLDVPISATSIPQDTISKGDVNGDGDITSIDASMTIQIIDGILSPTSEQLQAADADEDGQVTSTDAQMILQWAAQGLGANPSSFFTDIMELDVLETNSDTIGNMGGEVSLPSGVALSMPGGQLTEETEISLSKLDTSELDAVGNKVCYQVSPDLSYHSGSTLSVPYAAFLEPGGTSEGIEGVVIAFYDPWSRMNDMIVVNYTENGEALTIDLNQIREGSSFLPKQDSKLLIFIVSKSSVPPAAASVNRVSSLSVVASLGQSAMRLPVPYFEQGASDYCWACSTAMAINYCLSDRTEAGEKPWDIADYLEIGEGGISNTAFYWSKGYRNYIKLRTGVDPERSMWISSDSLKDYIKSQIDKDRPVILYLTGENHVVLVVGYEESPGITMLCIHDPKKRMYTWRSWSDIVYRWSWRVAYYTAVIPSASTDLEPVVINILGRRDPSKERVRNGLAFVSPMAKKGKTATGIFRKGNIRFSWYDEKTTEYGFVGHNGDGLAVKAIPKYYSMDLNLRVANAAPTNRNVKIKSWISDFYSGTMQFQDEVSKTIPSQSVQNVVIQSDKALDLEGKHGLAVKLRRQQDGSTIDSLQIPEIYFDQGITLEGTMKDQEGKKVVELEWSPYEGDFDSYVLYRINNKNNKWRPIRSKGIAKKQNTYTDDSCDPDNKNYYAVNVIKDNYVMITSDVIEVGPPDEIDLSRFKNCSIDFGNFEAYFKKVLVDGTAVNAQGGGGGTLETYSGGGSFSGNTFTAPCADVVYGSRSMTCTVDLSTGMVTDLNAAVSFELTVLHERGQLSISATNIPIEYHQPDYSGIEYKVKGVETCTHISTYESWYERCHPGYGCSLSTLIKYTCNDDSYLSIRFTE